MDLGAAIAGGEQPICRRHISLKDCPSLTPPAHGYPDNAGEQPSFVLIEPYAYFADRKNATTAECKITDPELAGSSIKVTFCTAPAPQVSYLCVHTIGLGDPEFADPPRIIATETNGSLVLLRVLIGNTPLDAVLDTSKREEFFVYDACGPSLDHLPHPHPSDIIDNTVAIVRKCQQRRQATRESHSHGSGSTPSAARHSRHASSGLQRCSTALDGRHASSGLQRCSTVRDGHHVISGLRGCSAAAEGHRIALRPHGARQDEDHDCSNSSCSYVIAAQSRWFGYDNPSQLCLYHSDTGAWSNQPVEVEPFTDYCTWKTFSIGGDKGTVAWVDCSHNIIFCDVLDTLPTLRSLQLPPPIQPSDPSNEDIAILGSSIKYVDLQPSAHGWRATVWSINTCSLSPEDWNNDYNLDSSELQHYDGTASHIGLPRLSLQDDGIVYFLTKVDYQDTCHKASVVAVDMMQKIVKEVGEFNPARSNGVSLDYDASRISKYLKVAPGTKLMPKRPGMPLLKSPSKKQTGDDAMVVDI